MASSFTTNKSLEKPANGDYVDTWNVPVNGDMDVIDQAFGGVTSLNATSGSVTLSSSQYRSLIILVSGAISANVVYTIPSGIGGQWIVYNTTTDSSGGPWTVTFVSGGGGTSQVILRNSPTTIYCDGTNIRTTSGSIPSGTNMLFYQAAAPTGWTQVTSVSDRVLRVVSGTGGVYGGTVPFSTYFSGSANVGSTAITEAQMPSHTHSINDPTHTHTFTAAVNGPGSYGQIGQGGNFSIGTTLTTDSSSTGISINSTGSSNGHTHTIPSLQYIDVIICTKS
jgi:hypothetical protein